MQALTRKVLSLEEEAEKRRKKDTIKVIKEPKKPKALKVKDNENINEVSQENVFIITKRTKRRTRT